MALSRAREIAGAFDLRALPADFYADPYPVYRVLRETEPVRLMPDGSYFLTRHEDLATVYRDAATFSFYGNKNMTTAEGGMVVTNDDDRHTGHVPLPV